MRLLRVIPIAIGTPYNAKYKILKQVQYDTPILQRRCTKRIALR